MIYTKSRIIVCTLLIVALFCPSMLLGDTVPFFVKAIHQLKGRNPPLLPKYYS